MSEKQREWWDEMAKHVRALPIPLDLCIGVYVPIDHTRPEPPEPEADTPHVVVEASR